MKLEVALLVRTALTLLLADVVELIVKLTVNVAVLLLACAVLLDHVAVETMPLEAELLVPSAPTLLFST